MMIDFRSIVIVVCLLLAACGSDSGSTSASTATAPNTTLINGAPTLVITIGGTSQGVDYDTVKVAGNASLSGNLQIQFVNGFKPSAGQRFIILTAAGGLSGKFDAVNAQGFAYTVSYDAISATVVIGG